MWHWGHSFSHDDPGLTLTCFMARSNLAPYVWEKVKTMDFSGTIIDCYETCRNGPQ